MATLVLTAAGSLLGGPIGGAIGAALGGTIDQQLFAPKGRGGARLQDLKVQTSRYGAAIPKLFGTIRVAGTVIWATDLVEQRARSGGGKGRGANTSYTYSASFAVLISGRPIRSVKRIWADGNLIRGAAGDWKVTTGFRLHSGDEGQDVDPFIASAESAANTPAYRGCGYAVFEHLALGSFGNRIPSLTFEVEADAGTVDLGAVCSEVTGGFIDGSVLPPLIGLAVGEETGRDLIETWRPALAMECRTEGASLRLASAADPVRMVGIADGERSGAESFGDAASLPVQIHLSHYDPERDYQVGVQGASTSAGGRAEQVELPAVLGADVARGLADAVLVRREQTRERRTIQVGWAALTIRPGDLVQVTGETRRWRVLQRSVRREGIELELTRIARTGGQPLAADPGRALPSPDEVPGTTVVHLLDLPGTDDDLSDQPRLQIAAAGTDRGWRRASLLTSLDGGASWSTLGDTGLPAVIGTTRTALASASPRLFDRKSTLEVKLLHDAMSLEDADAARILGGANLALVGNELIQFASAVPLGADRWRLRDLLRARRGTEWAVDGHAIGERFVLIEAETLRRFDPPLTAAGGQARVMASGTGDAIPAIDQADDIGAALRPPSPVHLAAQLGVDGGFDLSWVRRSRRSLAWLDGIDAPLAEAEERYQLVFTRGDGSVRTALTSGAFQNYTSADVAADRLAGDHVIVAVAQMGAGLLSRAATLRIDFS